MAEPVSALWACTATRILAVHGADVVRLDSPALPEIPLHVLDTLPGKHSALVDLGTAPGQAALKQLLGGADVVVTGYRRGALDRFGLAPEDLAARHPGVVVVTLSAWGHAGPVDGPSPARRPGCSRSPAKRGNRCPRSTPRRSCRTSPQPDGPAWPYAASPLVRRPSLRGRT